MRWVVERAFAWLPRSSGSASATNDARICVKACSNWPAAPYGFAVCKLLAKLADERDADGRRLVVRNGFHAPRKVTTSSGSIEVKAPRVNDKRVDVATGERKRFSSAILPPWARKSSKIPEVLPLLYLHGLSTGDFVPALEQFLGSSAGLSAATISRLTVQR